MNLIYQEWIRNNFSKIQLEVSELSWIKEFFPNAFDMQANILVGNRNYEGFGFSNEIDGALSKALSEAVERAICLEYVDSTNGVASHFDIELAKKNSLNELIERDLFLSHFLTKTPFIPFPRGIDLIPKKAVEYIRNVGDEIQILKTKETNLGQGYICLIHGNLRWGGIIGLSFGSEDEEGLVQKSLLEAFRSYWHLREKSLLYENLSLKDFLKKENWTFSDHGKLFLNVEYYQSIAPIFSGQSLNSKFQIVNYEISSFQWEVLKSTQEELQDCPLFVVVSRCRQINHLNAGPFSRKNISEKSLERFGWAQECDLNMLPHPVN